MNDKQLTTVNDGDLATAMNESLSGMHMGIPLETIVSHGRKVRARRRIPGLAAALAVLAAAPVAASALLTASHPAGMQLAAWTVATHGNGTVKVTIRRLHDPAGLQHSLRADGIPASITFFRHENQACRPYDAASGRQAGKIFSYQAHGRAVVLLLHPKTLPDHAGVQISVSRAQPPGANNGFAIVAGLVQASPRCTGS